MKGRSPLPEADAKTQASESATAGHIKSAALNGRSLPTSRRKNGCRRSDSGSSATKTARPLVATLTRNLRVAKRPPRVRGVVPNKSHRALRRGISL